VSEPPAGRLHTGFASGFWNDVVRLFRGLLRRGGGMVGLLSSVTVRRVAAVSLSALAPLSCSTPPSAAPGSPTTGGRSASTGLRYFVESRERVLTSIDVMLNNLAAPCMTAKGYRLPIRSERPSGSYLPYGIPEDGDPSLGFHTPAGVPADDPDLYSEESEPMFQAAMVGDSQTAYPVQLQSGGVVDLFEVQGCLGDARTQAFGSQDSYLAGMAAFLRLQDLTLLAEADANSSIEFAILNKRWSECMAISGHSFATPWDAWNYEWPTPVGSDERDAASADVECKRSIDYTSTADEIRMVSYDQLLESNLGLLEEWAEFESVVNSGGLGQ
jgi:hypothetical protein